jgi:cytochrome c-type biogenesis protein CcmF
MTEAAIGRAALAVALALSIWGASAALVGARRRNVALVESARTAAYGVLALCLAAAGAMLVALLTNDTTVAYVAARSSAATPTVDKVLALWSADEGSLLLWNTVLAATVVAVARRFRRGWPAPFPGGLAILFGICAFFVGLAAGPVSPFEVLAAPPADGNGPPPLLQSHPLMAIHPPMLYVGFILTAVPFALGMSAAAAGSLPPRWFDELRRWALASWAFLTAGLLLGAMWSYTVLGWGGYWAWDPVENVALLPWITTTAFLHVVQVQERTKRFAVWALGLVMASYALTILAAFLTRGAVLVSVHTFAESTVGPAFLAFLGVVLIGGIGVLAVRAPALSAPAVDIPPLSRGAAHLANNAILLSIGAVVLIGTLFPLLAEAIDGRRVTIGAPYFDRHVGPLMLVVLLVLAAGSLLPWRGLSVAELVLALRGPAVTAAATALVVAFVGSGGAVFVATIAIAAFAGASIVAWAWRRGLARRGPHAPRAVAALLAHLGLVVVVVGVAASITFERSSEARVAAGQDVAIDGGSVSLADVSMWEEPHRRVVGANVELRLDGQPQTMQPRINLYPGASEPVAVPALSIGTPANGFRDVSVTLLGTGTTDDEVHLRVSSAPGVTWIWIGGALMTAGGAMGIRTGARGRREAWPSVPEPGAHDGRKEAA